MRKIELWTIALCLLALLVPFAGCGRGDEAEVKEIAVEEETVSEPVTTLEGETTQEPTPSLEETPAPPPPAEVGAVPSETPPAPATPPRPAPTKPRTEPTAPTAGTPKPTEQTPPPATASQPEPTPEETKPAPPAPAPTTPTAGEADGAGQQVFAAQRCGTCHSVSTAGIKAKVTSGATAGGDLAGVSKRRDRAAITAILRQEEPVDGKKHPKRFSGTPDELTALIDWLLAQ